MRFFIMFLFSTIFLSSCIKDKNPLSSSSESVLFSDDYWAKYNFILDFNPNYNFVKIKKDVDSTVLSINKKTVFSKQKIIASEANPVFYRINFDSIGVTYNDSYLDFCWNINNFIFYDRLNLPSRINIDFPEYIEGQDYFLNWYTEREPDGFLIKLQIQDSLSNNLIIKDWQLAGHQNSLLIPSKYFNYENKYVILFSVISYNSIEWNNCLAISRYLKTSVFEVN